MKVEESILRKVLGDNPFIKIIDTLLDHPSHEYTKKELAEVTSLSEKTVYNKWNKIEELDVVEESRKIGNTTLYTANTESPVVEGLYKFEQYLLENGFEYAPNNDTTTR